MFNQTSNKIAREINKLNENETLALIEHISQILSTRSAPIHETPANDDLIASLSEQRENRRAQQVLEWERARRRNVSRAA